MLFCCINLHTLKVTLKIKPITINFSDNHLLVEAGDTALSFLIYTQNPMTLLGFYKFELDKNITTIDYTAALKTIIETENTLQQKFATTKIYYNFSTATLIPTKYFVDAEKENMLTLIFGKDDGAICFQENAINNEIKIVYRVAASIYALFNASLPTNRFKHATSSQIVSQKYMEDTLECIVYTHCIKLLLYKAGNIQIAQFFDYETPLDVSYHLLNVCQQFNVSPKVVKLILSGMIEEKSNLYDDIYKYFLNILFANLPTAVVLAEEMKVMPTHYYTNLVTLAVCV